MDHFQEWVSKRLFDINPEADLSIFLPYVTTILDDADEDSLIEILKEISGDNKIDYASIANDFLAKWNERNVSNGCCKEENATKSLDEKMHSIILQQNVDSARQFSTATSCGKSLADKNNIILQYGELSDEDEDESVDTNEKANLKENKSKSMFSSLETPLEDLLTRNTNAEQIKEREKLVREQAKLDSEAKKLKDKEDKEKQKTKAVDRKDAEKKRTQKGERRR